MGWYHSHLHEFIVEYPTKGTIYYGEPSPEDDYRHIDERRVRVAKIAPAQGATFVYGESFSRCDGALSVKPPEIVQT